MMDCSRYKIKVVKEIFMDLESDTEAEQVAEMFVSREVGTKMLGSVAFVYSDYELISA